MKLRLARTSAPLSLVTLLMVLLVPAPDPARAATAPREAYSIYLVGGCAGLDAEDLDRRFEDAGYPGFPQSMPAVGIGLMGGRRWLVALEYVGLLSTPEEVRLSRGRYQVTHGAYSIALSGGWRMIHGEHVRLFPLVGIGYGALTSEIKPLDAVDFDSVLVATGGKASFDGGTGIAELGAGFEYAFGKAPDSREPNRLVLGLRAGYCVSIGRPGWTQDEIDVRGGPYGRLRGPFVRVTAGFGN